MQMCFLCFFLFRYDLDCIDNGIVEEKSAEDGTPSATNSPTHNSSHTNRSYAARSVLTCGDLAFLISMTHVFFTSCMFISIVFEGGGEEHTPTLTHTHGTNYSICIRIDCIPVLKLTARYVCNVLTFWQPA